LLVSNVVMIVFRFVEFGEFRGNLYGTSYASIRSVVAAGRICLLTPHTQVSSPYKIEITKYNYAMLLFNIDNLSYLAIVSTQ